VGQKRKILDQYDEEDKYDTTHNIHTFSSAYSLSYSSAIAYPQSQPVI
jgi:hypothetical protein